jgi:hypothetical protein
VRAYLEEEGRRAGPSQWAGTCVNYWGSTSSLRNRAARTLSLGRRRVKAAAHASSPPAFRHLRDEPPPQQGPAPSHGGRSQASSRPPFGQFSTYKPGQSCARV